MTLLDLLTAVPNAADRLIPPPPIPSVLGDVTRLVVLAELVWIVWCCSFVVDRLRFVIPAAVHVILWALTAVLVGTAFGIGANLISVPPTTGIYLTALGTTAGSFLGVLAFLIALHPQRMMTTIRRLGLRDWPKPPTPPDHQEH